MTTDKKIRHEKLQYNVNWEAANIGKEVLPSDQSRITEEANFPCSAIGKALKKQVTQLKNKEKNKQMQLKLIIRGRSHISFRKQCVILMQTRWHPRFPTPCHMRHSQNFDKINSFLKSVLNIFILGNLIVGWAEGFLKERVGWYSPSNL